MVQPILTLVAAILSIAAIGLIPGSKAVTKGDTARYRSWGKGAIYFLAFFVLVVGIYILYEWYPNKERDYLTIGNMVLFAVLGVGLMANNAWVSGRIAKVEAEVLEPEIIEVVAIEVDDLGDDRLMEEKDRRSKKKVRSKGPKKKVRRTKPKVIKKKKAVPRPEADEELIPSDDEPVSVARSGNCPSCDTPVDHHDDSCPVCGEGPL